MNENIAYLQHPPHQQGQPGQQHLEHPRLPTLLITQNNIKIFYDNNNIISNVYLVRLACRESRLFQLFQELREFLL